MLERLMLRGVRDALACMGIKTAEGVAPPHMPAAPPAAAGGLGQKPRGFLSGQLEAGKDLLSNLRGGLGGQLNPDVLPAPGGDLGLTRAAHRARAVGNLKTLAPSLIAGGGLYMLHRRRQEAEEQRRHQAMVQNAFSQPMM